MTNTAKRLKSSAMMSAPSSLTAVTIPESQERGAALEKADLQDAIKSALHSQQPGLFSTHIHDWLMVERKELLGRYSNKDSIKAAVNQALNTMIEKGEVVRQKATTDKGGRSHLYALLDIAQSDDPKPRQSSSDWGPRGLPDALIQHTVVSLGGISNLHFQRPLKVEYQSPADSLPERKEVTSPDTELSKSLFAVDQDMQRFEALDRESTQLRDRMVELDRELTDLKRQVDEGK